MITAVAMPQMGLEVAEGVVVAIHVAVGARVAEGDPLVELETDKALSDVDAPRDGFVHSVEVQVGDTVAIGDTLVVLTADLGSVIDTSTEEPAPAGSDGVPVADGVPAADGAADSASQVVAARPPGEGRLRAAPVARRAAERLGVPLDDLLGTGPLGRITLKDVEQHAAALAAGGTPPAPASATATEQLEPLSGTRRAVARRMTQSQQIPQFALNREIDASWLLAEKEQRAHDVDAGVSINDLIVQALAETVLAHPDLACSYVEPVDDGGAPQLRRREGVDVALAVATERGLLVPVIRRAHERPLHELASERARLVAAARSGRLALEEMSGSTITLSSLAGFGVDSFVAMLNPGESAILAVGRAVEKVLPRGRGLAIAPTLSLTLTIDHRVIDGAAGGAALAELAALLEGAMTWRT